MVAVSERPPLTTPEAEHDGRRDAGDGRRMDARRSAVRDSIPRYIIYRARKNKIKYDYKQTRPIRLSIITDGVRFPYKSLTASRRVNRRRLLRKCTNRTPWRRITRDTRLDGTFKTRTRMENWRAYRTRKELTRMDKDNPNAIEALVNYYWNRLTRTKNCLSPPSLDFCKRQVNRLKSICFHFHPQRCMWLITVLMYTIMTMQN